MWAMTRPSTFSQQLHVRTRTSSCAATRCITLARLAERKPGLHCTRFSEVNEWLIPDNQDKRSNESILSGDTAMKTALLLGAFVLPLLLGGTACGHGIDEQGAIVRVKSPDERTGWLGVSIQDMSRRLAKAMDVKTNEGALVNEVMDNSPAEEAGLKDEDIIVEVDGK